MNKKLKVNSVKILRFLLAMIKSTMHREPWQQKCVTIVGNVRPKSQSVLYLPKILDLSQDYWLLSQEEKEVDTWPCFSLINKIA